MLILLALIGAEGSERSESKGACLFLLAIFQIRDH